LSLSKLQTWCSESNINPDHAVIVSIVPSDTSIVEVEEVLEAVKAFGRVRVRAQKSQLNREVLLCETRVKVDPTRVPPEILPPRGEASWKLTIRYNDTEASAQDYLAATENVFGTSESGEDLYFKFRSMQQKPNERLSDFVRRLEKVLTKAVEKGGLSHLLKDRARVEQLLRGAVDADILLLQLRLKERLSNPASFISLLSEIRSEEDLKITRQRTNSSVRRMAAAAPQALESPTVPPVGPKPNHDSTPPSRDGSQTSQSCPKGCLAGERDRKATATFASPENSNKSDGDLLAGRGLMWTELDVAGDMGQPDVNGGSA
uniref:Uncharacterized protein n=1 Tax=Hippocampus comes TaxID=109280 RepID=A0A3Q2Z0M1_HIPCM